MTTQTKRAIAVLGKKLIDDSITCEFAMRIAAMYKRVRQGDGEYCAVYFVGGGGEAEKARELFGDGRESLGVPVDTEEESEDTPSNLTNLMKKLSDRGFDHADVLSTDYHVDRNSTVDTYLKGASALQIMAMVNRRDIRAPYFFDHIGDLASKQTSHLYCLAERLGVPRINIEGILKGKEHRLFPEIGELFTDVMIDLKSQCAVANEHVLPILRAVLPLLGGVLSTFLSLQASPSVTLASTSSLLSVKRMLDEAMKDLRDCSDQDRPVTEDDWTQIEQFLGIEEGWRKGPSNKSLQPT